MSRDASGRTRQTCDGYYGCGTQYSVFRGAVWEMKVENGKLIPVEPGIFEKTDTIVVPDSLEDPKHFGHVIWKCCQLLKAVESS